MTTDDLVEIGKELAAKTREFVAREIGQFAGRLQSLEERMASVKDGQPGAEGPIGPIGPQGIKGFDGAPGRDGRDGTDGKDGAPGDRGERGERGEKGIDGEQGPVGPAGVAGLDGKDGAPGPQGEPGLIGPQGDVGPTGPKGDRGDVGAQGEPGAPGPAGRDGVDGKSVSLEDVRPIFEAEVAKTVLELERRALDMVQRAVDRMPPPKDGKDGRDGLDFGDLQAEHDGDRTVTLRAVRGDQVKELGRFVVPSMIYRGVFDDRRGYAKDDVTTWAGATWIAKCDQPTGKPNASPDWQLIVKKGSDGKQGPEGKPGPVGPQGPQGPPPVRAPW